MSSLTPQTAIVLAIIWPLLGAVLVAIFGEKRRNLREAATLLTAASLFAMIVKAILPEVLAGRRPGFEAVEILPGLALAFEVEPLGMLFALVASGLWFVTSLYAIGYMRGHDERNQTRFYICFAAAIFGALGVAFAANMFTLFIFYELITLSTFPLVTHHGTEKAKRSGRIYLGILMGTSIALLLFALVWTYFLTGTTDFVPGGILGGKISGGSLILLLMLYAFGTGKAALMPFHRWLPAAMVAPTPVSALLHAVAVVKAGVFTVMKVVVYLFGLDFLRTSGAHLWLIWAAAITLLLASIIALSKDNLKERLAYSTISQLSYIVLGVAIAHPTAALGAGMHIAMHAFGKITLFFCAGAIYVGAHKSQISDMWGLGKRMPITMTAFLIGSISVIGLPPAGGSWSKWFLALGSAQAGHPWLVFLFMTSSLLSIGYLMPVVGRAFFSKPRAIADHHHSDHDHGDGIQEAPLLCVLPPVLTAIGCLVLFFYADTIQTLLAGMLP